MNKISTFLSVTGGNVSATLASITTGDVSVTNTLINTGTTVLLYIILQFFKHIKDDDDKTNFKKK